MLDDPPITDPFATPNPAPVVQEHKPEPVVYGTVGSEPQPRVPDGCLKPLAIFSTVLSLFLLLVLGAMFFGSGGGDVSPNPPAPFEQEDRQARDLQGADFVFVYEGTAPTADQEEAFQIYGDEKLKSLGLRTWRRWDEENPAAEPCVEYALGRGVALPAMFLVRDKNIVDCAPFHNTQDVREFLGG
jgi:hypothetical protein